MLSNSPAVSELCDTGHMAHHPNIDNDLRYALRNSEKLELFLLEIPVCIALHHDHCERAFQTLEDTKGSVLVLFF